MNAVEKVKEICKERGIPLSRVEKDLGFSNGYISGLKKGVFPNDRALKIAEYLNIPIKNLTNENDAENVMNVNKIGSYSTAYEKAMSNPMIGSIISDNLKERLNEITQSIIQSAYASLCEDDLYVLIALFLKLNEDGKNRLYDYLEDLLLIGKYTESGEPYVVDWDGIAENEKAEKAKKVQSDHRKNIDVSSAEADYEKAFGIQSKQGSHVSNIIEDTEEIRRGL